VRSSPVPFNKSLLPHALVASFFLPFAFEHAWDARTIKVR
jgi:hypothetical protein